MKKQILSIFLAFVVGVSLSACNPQTGSPSLDVVTTPTVEPSPSWAPTFVEVVSVEGKEVTIKKKEFVEVGTFGSDSPNSWLIATDNEKVVKVGSGTPNNFANPFVEGISEGNATITLTNAMSGQVVVFAVKVSK